MSQALVYGAIAITSTLSTIPSASPKEAVYLLSERAITTSFQPQWLTHSAIVYTKRAIAIQKKNSCTTT